MNADFSHKLLSLIVVSEKCHFIKIKLLYADDAGQVTYMKCWGVNIENESVHNKHNLGYNYYVKHIN